MWDVYEQKTLLKAIKRIPQEVIRRYELWKRIVEMEGPSGLRLIKGLHDEALRGEWKGYRSSRLTLQWRVLYRIEKGALSVYVIDINPHDYRQR